jgi:hypothetical protein
MGTTYLTKTSGGGTDPQIATFSMWFKIGKLASSMYLFSGGDGASNNSWLRFQSDGKLYFRNRTSSSNDCVKITQANYVDPNGWYHVVLKFNSTLSTAADRTTMYINGQEVTAYSSSTDMTQNNLFHMFGSTTTYIGKRVDDGTTDTVGEFSASHIHFCDGYAYDASAFGETDATSGIWKPILSPSVTYGTNGFFLKFGNAGSLGTDSSGNGNNFTVNGSGTQTLDTPSNVFATLNPLINFQNSSSYSNGNNTVTGGGTGSGDSPSSTLAVSSGKYYCEVKIISTDAGGEGVGIIDIDKWNPYANADEWFFRYSYGYGYANANGNKFNNNSGSAYGDSYTNGDIVGIALDLDNNYLYFSKNGVWQNSGDPTSGATGTGAAFNIASGNYVFSFYHYYSHVLSANFGNGYFGTTAVSTPESDSAGIGKFEYSVPSGYYALCTKNIATYG